MTPMIDNIVPVSPQQLQREVAELQSQLRFVRLPDLGPLRHEVSRLTTLTALDPKHRGDLYSANATLEEANRTHAHHAEEQARLAGLQRQLEAALQAQRMDNIALANAKLDAAENEYVYAAVAAAKAYRRLLDQSRANGRVPGARFEHAEGLHVPFLMPPGYQGTLAEAMAQGVLPFESSALKAA